ncbi:Protein NAM8 [Hypsizygus marmoreus]|uniref:Protein NAM8 n=1 Tax=Hypsizygus marmoreus TaxID=39966 RepID=A0A369JMX9_HYPMA|nr:Protein NAM8 [Hypsizygus marmoreus]
MSRTDGHEFEYPPGLTGLRHRGSNEREQLQGGYYSSPLFSPTDRRPSLGILSHAGYTNSVPRAMGLGEREYGIGMDVGPNRHNSNAQSFSNLNLNHHRRSSPPPPPPPPPSFHAERDPHLFRTTPSSTATTPPPNITRNTLWWGDIEPWMDEEYAKQVCALMGWDPVSIRVPHPAPDPVTGQQLNNPGFCYLTFNTTAQASSVLAQINNPGNGAPVTMPNSSKPFVLNWASAVHSAASPASNAYPQPTNPALQQYPKEYSIFVGDLAPETSNSDLVAVFRNPVLGLRNDREPKFIRPFLSCKSAKIMLDPVTESPEDTVSCDSPMRLINSYKAPPVAPSLDLPQVQFPPSGLDHQPQPQPVTIALPLPSSNLTKSVSFKLWIISRRSTLGGSNSSNSLISGGSTTSASSSGFGSLTSEDMLNLPNSVLVQIAQQYASGETAPIKVNGGSSITQQFAQDAPNRQSGRWRSAIHDFRGILGKHHAQARAILGNLIGPNGEQLTSTDPYNTTVFVGGLSPLISEETLRTFFAPFGDIHYVKVPVGKHCGFVQFVRKADAERAIEKMQGFPIGGSRIRLSWGRSQYKAAQAAAQAAQAAALQTQFPTQVPLAPNMMTQEQAIQLLQKLNLQGYLDYIPGSLAENVNDSTTSGGFTSGNSNNSFSEGKTQQPVLVSRDEQSHIFEAFPSTAFPQRPEVQRTQSSFAPFSPDPNGYVSVPEPKRDSFSRSEGLPHPSKAYAPGFFPVQTQQDLKVNTNVTATAKTSPTSTRPGSASRYNSFLESSGSFGVNRAPGRPEAAISRPPSGQTIGPQTRAESETQELDAMHDLNGTLASLDLDRPSWKSPPPESSGSSSGSVQFRMTTERSPSPSN